MKSIVVALVPVALLAAGCSSVDGLLESRKVDYKSAGRLPPLEIPPDLTRPTTDDRFAVPDINPSGSATYSAYSKERSAKQVSTNPDILPKVSNAHIERAGTQRWLVVDGSPDALWPTVKGFWQETGFLVNLEVPEAGVMETDWAESRARVDDGIIRGALGKLLGSVSSTAERDKFRTRLERGEDGVTEIYISHRGMDEVMEGDIRTRWQPRPADPDLEAEMLSRLMMRFGVAEERARTSVASAGKAPERARLTGEKGGVLTVDEAFDRCWRRVGLALDRIGFTVEDRNRSQGIYFVRYINPDVDSGAGPGFFSKLLFWRDEKDEKRDKYRIQLSEVGAAGESTDVKVLNSDGEPEKSSDANRILKLLHEQLK
jgi:outer membrane protein assembly factor BamC